MSECHSCVIFRATLAEQEKQLIARQIWIDKYAKQTEVALQQRDEASDAVAEQAREIERLRALLRLSGYQV